MWDKRIGKRGKIECVQSIPAVAILRQWDCHKFKVSLGHKNKLLERTGLREQGTLTIGTGHGGESRVTESGGGNRQKLRMFYAHTPS